MPTIGLICVLMGALLIVARRGFLVVTVRGASMEPTYRDGDRLLAVRWRIPRRGRVVVFRPPVAWQVGHRPPYFVKRVVAAEGDVVPGELGTTVSDRVVPRGQLVVYGDSPVSTDSRTCGYLPVDAVRAVVVTAFG
jgi:signal peptidase I